MKPEYLHQIASELGFQFDESSSAIYGEQSGYLFVLIGTGNKNQFRVNFSVKAREEGDQVFSQTENPLQELARQSSAIANVKVDQYTVSVLTKSGMTKGKTVEKLRTALAAIVQFLEENHYVQVCSQTGEEGNVGLYQLGESIFIINEQSFQLLKTNLQLDVDSYENQKENVLLGIVGAFLGALIGGAVALFIARLGYVAMAAGIVLGICTIKGYELLGKKLTKKGVVISSILMLVTVFLVNQINLAMEVIAHLGLEFGQAFQVVNHIIFIGEIPDNYFFNLGMLAVFTLGGAWAAVSATLSSHKAKGIARKIA